MVEKVVKKINKDERKKLNMVQRYTPQQLNELLKILTTNQSKAINETVGEPDYLKIGICSDKHYNDKQCDEGAIRDLYSEFDSNKVDAVVDGGDMTAGINVYKGQMFDLLNVSFEDQIQHIVDQHPKLAEGKKTYFINGNHDMAWNDVAGINFGVELEKRRPDLVNVGSYQGEVTLNDIKIGLQHGSRGLPYAVSYHLQKYIEKIPQGKEPDIYCLGHYHSALTMDYHGIMCFLPGAFQRGNLLTKRMGIPEDNIGGRLVEIIKEGGKIKINPKYYRF